MRPAGAPPTSPAARGFLAAVAAGRLRQVERSRKLATLPGAPTESSLFARGRVYELW